MHPVWCLLSKNSLECFVIVGVKSKQHFKSPTFLADTKLHVPGGVYRETRVSKLFFLLTTNVIEIEGLLFPDFGKCKFAMENWFFPSSDITTHEGTQKWGSLVEKF